MYQAKEGEHFEKANFEKMCDIAAPIYSPMEDSTGNLYIVSSNGDIYMVQDSQLDLMFSTGGQPTAIVFDSQGSAFIADTGHKAILSQTEIENKYEICPIVKDFEGAPLLGPNSLLVSADLGMLFFTDSGSFGHTGLHNPKGSIFGIDLELNELRPIMAGGLANPYGIAMGLDEKRIYIAETGKNRILRFVQSADGVYHSSCFYQFSGRFGPTAIAMHAKGYLFVARYDFASCAQDGLLSVINENGELIMELGVENAPEITGLCFSKQNENILFLTEITNNSLLKILVNLK